MLKHLDKHTVQIHHRIERVQRQWQRRWRWQRWWRQGGGDTNDNRGRDQCSHKSCQALSKAFVTFSFDMPHGSWDGNSQWQWNLLVKGVWFSDHSLLFFSEPNTSKRKIAKKSGVHVDNAIKALIIWVQYSESQPSVLCPSYYESLVSTSHSCLILKFLPWFLSSSASAWGGWKS